MNSTAKTQKIIHYVTSRKWLEGDLSCRFLASGEYNENYLLESAGRKYVFRINHGTQLGLANQIEYEFYVLEAVCSSRVTPLPYNYSLEGEDLGNGVLLMEFVEGRALDYGTDLHAAAHIFAGIHSLPVDSRLIRQDNPIIDICRESLGLLNRFVPHHFREVHTRLSEYHDELFNLAENKKILFADEPLCIVNTEVNSGNFIIGETRSCLVDWEKAVVSCRYQDLAHFLLATTTLWKTDWRLSNEQKKNFLKVYHQTAQPDLPLDVLLERTMLMEKVILLRALSWCYMAYHEYTQTDRPLNHDFTFAKITTYLNEAECFFG